MGPEANKELFRRLIEQGDITVVDELLAPGLHTHEALPPGVAPGREGSKQLFHLLRSALPDLRVGIEELLAEGNKVVARLTVSGTHRGDFMGMPPAKRAVRYQVIDIVRIRQGQLVEHWGMADMMGLMQQLSAPPAREAAPPESPLP